MTNAERREKRRQAGLKGAATRHARTATATHQDSPGAPPRVETAEERATRAHSAEEKRLTNLRALLRQAQAIRRESDLYSHAHSHRWHHSPKRWTPEQIDEATRFIAGFLRNDGTPQPDPVRRKGNWRL